MARILFISSYYPPEKAAAAVCVSEAAMRLLKWKHEVTVLTTFPNYPTGVVFPGYHRALIRLSEWLEWSTYHKASLVWVVIERVCDLLIKRGLPEEKIFLQTYGVDTEQFHPIPPDQARATQRIPGMPRQFNKRSKNLLRLR